MEADEHAPGKTRQPVKTFWRRFESKQVIKQRKKRNKAAGSVRKAVNMERYYLNRIVCRLEQQYLYPGNNLT